MSGGVPAGELRDFASLMVDEVIAKVRMQLDAGESLSVADQRLMLEQLIVERKRLHATPTPPIEGRDADVERVARAIAKIDHNGRVAEEAYWANPDTGCNIYRVMARAALQALGERP